MKEYECFGIMLDCSRNAVMKVNQVKKFIDCMVKMGYNVLELYAEDTYLLEGEPYFGYLRGGYSSEEIKEIDAYAKARSIELIPCVQTLAHFTNLVKLPQYNDIVDVDDILLIDEEKTYALIEKIIANAAKNFSSRRINIGMDEAHMVGLGKYLDKHGYHNRFDLLTRHLAKVVEITEKYGFTSSHIWSDMFFRPVNNGRYHGRDLHIPKEIVARMPKNIELAYWDYYNTDTELIDSMLASHLETGKRTWFAGGAWSWNGFAPMHQLTVNTMKAAMQSVAKTSVRDVLITMWGDNGKECSFFAMLPSLYAIRRYADGVLDEGQIVREFQELFGVNYEDFTLLELPNLTKAGKEYGRIENLCKLLFYNDCFLGKYDCTYEKPENKIDFGALSKKISEAVCRMGEYAYIFETIGALCDVLDIKAELGIRTRKAYRAGDKVALQKLTDEYTICVERLKTFYNRFKALWYTENKGFGFEIHDARLGGLMQRLTGCRERLLAYASGKIEQIEELEADVLLYSNSIQDNTYTSIISTATL